MIVGGRESPFAPLNDVWVLSCQQKGQDFVAKWQSAPVEGDSFGGRWGHSATCIERDDGSFEVIVFGGRNSEGCLDDVVSLTITHAGDAYKVQSKVLPCAGPTPSPRYGHASVALGEYVLIHGGYTSIKHDPAADSDSENEGPQVFTPRMLDEAPLHSDEMFLLHVPTATWKQVTMTGSVPPPLASHALVEVKHGATHHLAVIGGASPRLQDLGFYTTRLHSDHLGA